MKNMLNISSTSMNSVYFSSMIKTLRLVLLLALIANSKSSYSQYKYSISAGASHERLFGSSGSHVRMYYIFHEHIRFFAGYSYYLEVTHNDGNQTVTNELRAINLNFNYIIYLGKRLGIYPILGLNYVYGSEIIEDNESKYEDFKEDLGMNAGFGVSYQMGRFAPYIESNSVIINQSNLVVSAGLSYSFGHSDNEAKKND